jgi:hypothetical protein
LESREASFMLDMASGTVLSIPIAVRSPGWNWGLMILSSVLTTMLAGFVTLLRPVGG